MIAKDHPELFNFNKYCIKLPFVAGGYLNDKRSVKYGVGAAGIIKSIKQFLRWSPAVLGYIPYVIIQPKFPYSTEAKVSLKIKLSVFVKCLA